MIRNFKTSIRNFLRWNINEYYFMWLKRRRSLSPQFSFGRIFSQRVSGTWNLQHSNFRKFSISHLPVTWAIWFKSAADDEEASQPPTEPSIIVFDSSQHWTECSLPRSISSYQLTRQRRTFTKQSNASSRMRLSRSLAEARPCVGLDESAE